MPQNNIKQNLEKETQKWLLRIEKEVKKIKSTRDGEDNLKNMNAYISDCKYFMQKNDWIRAFEAVVYAWAILETCLRLGVFKK